MPTSKIVVSITRDQLIADQNPKTTQYLKAGGRVLKELREAGVPIIGAIGLFGVEYGTLTMHMEDGLDGDELVYTFIGEPLDEKMRKREFTFSKPLPKATINEDEDDEL